MTDLARSMVTVQVVPETASQPVQPLKMARRSSVTSRVTTVPKVYETAQVAPQLIWLALAGLEVDVTVPFPTPRGLALLTDSLNFCRAKFAVTVLPALMVTVQVEPDAVSHPVQPVSTDPTVAAAVSVTTVPVS